MNKFKVLGILLLLMTAVLISGFSSKSAHAAQLLQSTSSSINPCTHLHIILQKTQQPIAKCLDATIASQNKQIPPLIFQDSCPGGLMLFWDGGFTGGNICFSGAGATDLTSYPAPWWHGGTFVSWNDAVSSYVSSNTTGKFYENIGQGGVSTFFSANESVDFSNNWWNDKISSICINGSGFTCL